MTQKSDAAPAHEQSARDVGTGIWAKHQRFYAAVSVHDYDRDPEAPIRYREAVLAPGGSRDAALMVRDFLGRDYTFDAFARWLDGTDGDE